MSKSISKMNKKELYEECKKIKQENLGLSFDLNLIRDELIEIYEIIGEKVGNTNLPRFPEQVAIELDKLVEEKERYYKWYVDKEKQVMNNNS